MLPKRWLRAPLLTAVQQVKLLAEREARRDFSPICTRLGVAQARGVLGDRWGNSSRTSGGERRRGRMPDCTRDFREGRGHLGAVATRAFGMGSGPPIPIHGRGICTTDIRCKRRDLNAGQQFFQYPGFDPYRHPTPLAIAASSAMIAAPSSVNRALRSRSRRNRAIASTRRSNTASCTVATTAAAACWRALARLRYHNNGLRLIPSASHGRCAGLRGPSSALQPI